MVLPLHRPSELSDHNRKAPIVVLTNHSVKLLPQLVGNNGPLNSHEVIVFQMRLLFGLGPVSVVLLKSLFCVLHKDIVGE